MGLSEWKDQVLEALVPVEERKLAELKRTADAQEKTANATEKLAIAHEKAADAMEKLANALKNKRA